MSTSPLPAPWQQERAFLQNLRKTQPEALNRPEAPTQDRLFAQIGIAGLPEDRTPAYIRLYPQDFLIEEISLDGHRVELTDAPVFYETEDKRTLWVTMVKAHMSQFDALKEVAAGLNIPLDAISYAGIKDTVAVTSQRLALRGVTREQVETFSHKRIIIRPFSYGSGSLQAGSLRGNLYTLVLRTEAPVETHILERRLNRPFWNFFAPQRFGARTLAHKLGQKILQGDVEGCLKAFFTEPGINDVPFYKNLRQQLADAYGDWHKMDEICSALPFSLGYERTALAALKRDPQNLRGALDEIKEQVRTWVNAYGWWLMNRELSRLVAKDEDPVDTIPTPFSARGPSPVYEATMKAEGTDRYPDVFAQYPYLVLSDKPIPTQIHPHGVRIENVPQGCLMRFTLEKGGYPIICLSHAFQIIEGLPVPNWVKDGTIDGLAQLHEHSIKPVLERFEPEALQRRDAFLNEDGGEA